MSPRSNEPPTAAEMAREEEAIARGPMVKLEELLGAVDSAPECDAPFLQAQALIAIAERLDILNGHLEYLAHVLDRDNGYETLEQLAHRHRGKPL